MIKKILMAAIISIFQNNNNLYAETNNSSTLVPEEQEITPLPQNNIELDADKVSLGQLLFHEKKISKDNTISCASCHNLAHGGADGRERSVGINGLVGDINAPTVYNSGFNFRQFWNGRAKTLEDQIEGPVQNTKEMGARWEDVIAKLKLDPIYEKSFKIIYSDGITRENVKNAIATFERSLVTPNSRFDYFLKGDLKALNTLEKKGLVNFKSYGCISCHQGMNIGGNMYQTMGVMGNYFKDRGRALSEADQGRYAVTKNESDRGVFRVPSLRNVALTAPYFHDGSAKNLNEAVRVMAKYQIGRNLSDDDINAIVAFLKTLTGVHPQLSTNNRPKEKSK